MLSDFVYYAQIEQKICNSFSLQQHDRQPPSLNKLDSLRVLTGVLVFFTRDVKKKKQLTQKEQNIELPKTWQTNSVMVLEATKVAPLTSWCYPTLSRMQPCYAYFPNKIFLEFKFFFVLAISLNKKRQNFWLVWPE